MHVSTQYIPANLPSSLAPPSCVGSRVASTPRMPQRTKQRGREAAGGPLALITPAVDDNRSLAGRIIKDLPASGEGHRGKRERAKLPGPGIEG